MFFFKLGFLYRLRRKKPNAMPYYRLFYYPHVVMNGGLKKKKGGGCLVSLLEVILHTVESYFTLLKYGYNIAS